MARAKNSTRRSQIKPLGVAERLGHAPPTKYVRGRTGKARPKPTDTYVVDDVTHTFDGSCHDACENVR